MYRQKLILLFTLAVISWGGMQAENISYRISDIPAALKKDAKAVIRRSEMVMEVKSPGSATMKVYEAISILNKNGIDNATFHESYDKFSAIHNLKATIYDENGNKVRRVPSDQIFDLSANSSYAGYEDNRQKIVDPAYRNVPFTIVYEYTVDYKGLLYYPAWLPFNDFNISIEKSSFELLVPKEMHIRYYEQNLPVTSKKNETKDDITYNWKLENQPVIKSEPFCPPILEFCPAVFIAPDSFEIDNLEGNAETWKNLGLWVNSINKGRDQLSPETKARVEQLIGNAKSDSEKVAILYHYLQENTRYVNIEIGIGSWQPIDALTVDRTKYGDCKALTNYMKSLLEVAGIKSFYTIANAGDDAAAIKTGFPSLQFNHVFLCVPIQNDTLWLECTSQKVPMGYLGRFTDDRNVLLITDQGGKMIHTKKYTSKDNMEVNSGTVTLNPDADSKADMYDTYGGVLYDDFEGILASDAIDRKKLMYKKIDIPSFNIDSYSLKEVKQCMPRIEETLHLSLENYCTMMGDNLLVPINLMDKMYELPGIRDKRKTNVEIRRAKTYIDTIRYIVPAGYKVFQLPKNQELTSDFGNYRYQLKVENGQVEYIRYLEINKGYYEPSRYTDFEKFFNQIARYDDAKMVLKKQSDLSLNE